MQMRQMGGTLGLLAFGVKGGFSQGLKFMESAIPAL